MEDVGTGEAINQPSRGDAHDLALKSAVSGALKRCAKDLGDQYGLGLYDKGSLEPTVRKVIAYDAPLVLGPAPASPNSRDDGAPASGSEAPQGAPPARAGDQMLSEAQRRKIYATGNDLGWDEAMLKSVAAQLLRKDVPHLTELTKIEGVRLIDELTKRRAQFTPAEGEESFT